MTIGEQQEADPRKVFVIHGRNDLARKALFDFLRAIGLHPIEWSQALAMTGQASPYIGDVLDAAFNAAQAVVVLQTPDDVAYLHESLTYPEDPETQPQMQPRPNVLFEAGMAMGRAPDRTIIVELGRVKVFSDIHGRHAVRLDSTVAKRQDLASRLRTAGCAVNLEGTDWHTTGSLEPPSPPGGGLPLGRKLPSSAAAGRPRLSATYRDLGGNKIGNIVVTNHGPGDVFELDARPADGEEHQIHRETDELPIPRLPEGKSVIVLHRDPPRLSSSYRSFFEIVLTGRTADGTQLEVTEFVSTT